MELQKEIKVTPSLLTSHLNEDGFGSDVTRLVFTDPLENEEQKHVLTQALERSRTVTTISLLDAGLGAVSALLPYLSSPTCQITTLIITGKISTLLGNQKSSKILTDALVSNKSLTTLKLEDVKEASPEILGTISSYLKTSTTLCALSLKGTAISLATATDLADGLANNKSLQKLNLSSCTIEDRDCMLLADALKAHPTLRVLDLSHNLFTAKGLARSYMRQYEDFDGSGHEALKSLLLETDVLEELDIEGCDTDFEDVAHICVGLGLNKSLTALRLEPAAYCDEAVQIIEKYVRRNLMSRSQYWAAVALHNLLRDSNLPPEIWVQILSYVFPLIENFHQFACTIMRWK